MDLSSRERRFRTKDPALSLNCFCLPLPTELTLPLISQEFAQKQVDSW